MADIEFTTKRTREVIEETPPPRLPPRESQADPFWVAGVVLAVLTHVALAAYLCVARPADYKGDPVPFAALLFMPFPLAAFVLYLVLVLSRRL